MGDQTLTDVSWCFLFFQRHLCGPQVVHTQCLALHWAGLPEPRLKGRWLPLKARRAQMNFWGEALCLHKTGGAGFRMSLCARVAAAHFSKFNLDSLSRLALLEQRSAYSSNCSTGYNLERNKTAKNYDRCSRRGSLWGRTSTFTLAGETTTTR